MVQDALDALQWVHVAFAELQDREARKTRALAAVVSRMIEGSGTMACATSFADEVLALCDWDAPRYAPDAKPADPPPEVEGEAGRREPGRVLCPNCGLWLERRAVGHVNPHWAGLDIATGHPVDGHYTCEAPDA